MIEIVGKYNKDAKIGLESTVNSTIFNEEKQLITFDDILNKIRMCKEPKDIEKENNHLFTKLIPEKFRIMIEVEEEERRARKLAQNKLRMNCDINKPHKYSILDKKPINGENTINTRNNKTICKSINDNKLFDIKPRLRNNKEFTTTVKEKNISKLDYCNEEYEELDKLIQKMKLKMNERIGTRKIHEDNKHNEVLKECGNLNNRSRKNKKLISKVKRNTKAKSFTK